jgi:hypothetical protein
MFDDRASGLSPNQGCFISSIKLSAHCSSVRYRNSFYRIIVGVVITLSR